MDCRTICQLCGVFLLFSIFCFIFYESYKTNNRSSKGSEISHYGNAYSYNTVIEFGPIPRNEYQNPNLQNNTESYQNKNNINERFFNNSDSDTLIRNEVTEDIKDKFHFNSSLPFDKSIEDLDSISEGSMKHSTEVNLYTEMKYINETTSLRPEKSVIYNKIVPRKGVDNIEINQTLSTVNTCFWKTEKVCYSAHDFEDVECNCCKNANEMGELIQQQPLNCSNCTKVNFSPLGNESFCLNICCNKKFSIKTSYEISTTEDILYKNLNSISNNKLMTDFKKLSESYSTKSETSEKLDLFKTKLDLENKNVLQNLTKKIKQKPSITKVPYDVEIFTEVLKAKKEVFLPVVVSLFLLPLFAIILFFLWKRIQHSWNERYYKRVDYLLDEMYNE